MSHIFLINVILLVNKDMCNRCYLFKVMYYINMFMVVRLLKSWVHGRCFSLTDEVVHEDSCIFLLLHHKLPQAYQFKTIHLLYHCLHRQDSSHGLAGSSVSGLLTGCNPVVGWAISRLKQKRTHTQPHWDVSWQKIQFFAVVWLRPSAHRSHPLFSTIWSISLRSVSL